MILDSRESPYKQRVAFSSHALKTVPEAPRTFPRVHPQTSQHDGADEPQLSASFVASELMGQPVGAWQGLLSLSRTLTNRPKRQNSLPCREEQLLLTAACKLTGNRRCTSPSCTNMYIMPKRVIPRPPPKHSPPVTPGVKKPYKHRNMAGTPLTTANKSLS
jgi:hypothetical protein